MTQDDLRERIYGNKNLKEEKSHYNHKNYKSQDDLREELYGNKSQKRNYKKAEYEGYEKYESYEVKSHIKNKHGIASALISIVLIISFFMPFISGGGESISTFDFFKNVASSGYKEWVGILFFIYMGLVGINILVQLANGSKGFSSFTGIAGIGFMILFVIVIKSEKFGNQQLEFLKEHMGSGVWMSGLSILALLIVPQFFEDDDELEEVSKDIEFAEEELEPKKAPSSVQVQINNINTNDEVAKLKERIAKLEQKKNDVTENTDSQQAIKGTSSDLEALKAEAERLKAIHAQREAEKERLQKEKLEKERLEKEKLMEEIARLKKQIGDSEDNA